MPIAVRELVGRFALGVAIAMGPGAAPFAFADQGLFGLLPAIGGTTSKSNSDQPMPVKNLQGNTSAPARKSGRHPAALVEDIKGAAGAFVDTMDYVYPGQTIELGPSGHLVLSYFDSCVNETIDGGTVSVQENASAVSGGKIASRKLPCQTAKPVISAEASEAGASAKRLTPFAESDWQETTIKTDRPVFKWERSGGEASLALGTDGADGKTIWQTTSTASFVAYPANAPKLETGVAYRVVVTAADGQSASARFSIDPGLDVADTIANRTVAVGQ